MANEFLWKKISEQEKKEIKVRAKEIMDNFAEKLEGVKEIKNKEEDFKSTQREENTKCKTKINRDTMFQNAPNKNDDFIIAEKKKW